MKPSLDAIVEPTANGDPMSPSRWTTHSTRKGQPLVSLGVMIEWIGHTTSQTGLKVYAMEDHDFYPTKRKISDKEMNEMNLVQDETLGKWNDAIKPR